MKHHKQYLKRVWKSQVQVFSSNWEAEQTLAVIIISSIYAEGHHIAG